VSLASEILAQARIFFAKKKLKEIKKKLKKLKGNTLTTYHLISLQVMYFGLRTCSIIQGRKIQQIKKDYK